LTKVAHLIRSTETEPNIDAFEMLLHLFETIRCREAAWNFLLGCEDVKHCERNPFNQRQAKKVKANQSPEELDACFFAVLKVAYLNRSTEMLLHLISSTVNEIHSTTVKAGKR
jgi:hypothetical protein